MRVLEKSRCCLFTLGRREIKEKFNKKAKAVMREKRNFLFKALSDFKVT